MFQCCLYVSKINPDLKKNQEQKKVTSDKLCLKKLHCKTNDSNKMLFIHLDFKKYKTNQLCGLCIPNLSSSLKWIYSSNPLLNMFLK